MPRTGREADDLDQGRDKAPGVIRYPEKMPGTESRLPPRSRPGEGTRKSDAQERESIPPRVRRILDARRIRQAQVRQTEIDKLRAEAVLAARQALNDAERDVGLLRKQLQAGPSAANLDQQQISHTKTSISEWLSRYHNDVRDDEAAIIAVQELTKCLERLDASEVSSSSINSLREAIASLRRQIDVVERRALSLELAEAYKRASLKIRWKVTIGLAATTAGVSAGGDAIAQRIILAALASSFTSAVFDEVHDWVARRSRERTPIARFKEAHKKMVALDHDLVRLLQRHTNDTPPQEAELEIMRTAHLAVALWARNTERRASECDWLTQPEYLGTLSEVKVLLAEANAIIERADYTNAKQLAEEMGVAAKRLADDLPPDEEP